MHEIPEKQALDDFPSVVTIRHYDEARFPFYRRDGMGVKPLIICETQLRPPGEGN